MTRTEHLAAVVRDGQVRVESDGRLLRLDEAAEWPFHTELLACTDDPAAYLMAPTWLLGREPDRYLHLLWSPAAEGELRALTAVEEAPEVLEALQTGIREWTDPHARPALRPDWYAPGWLAGVEGWVDGALAALGARRTGSAELIRMWSLSAVLRICTDQGPVFFKATCRHFHGEPGITAVLRRYDPQLTPELIAIEPERSWMLMRPLPGEHPRPRRAGDGPPTAAALARLQLDLVPACDQLLAAGAADRRLEPTIAALDLVLRDSVEADRLNEEESAVVRQLGPWLGEVLTDLAGCGLPYSISHGDLHTGNIAREGDQLVIYDWTDAAVSFPTLDVSLLAAAAGEEHEGAIWNAYATVWQASGFDVDLDQVLELSRIGRLAYQAISYEQIFRSEEPRVRWEMAGGVADNLKRLAVLWPGRR